MSNYCYLISSRSEGICSLLRRRISNNASARLLENDFGSIAPRRHVFIIFSYAVQDHPMQTLCPRRNSSENGPAVGNRQHMVSDTRFTCIHTQCPCITSCTCRAIAMAMVLWLCSDLSTFFDGRSTLLKKGLAARPAPGPQRVWYGFQSKKPRVKGKTRPQKVRSWLLALPFGARRKSLPVLLTLKESTVQLCRSCVWCWSSSLCFVLACCTKICSLYKTRATRHSTVEQNVLPRRSRDSKWLADQSVTAT